MVLNAGYGQKNVVVDLKLTNKQFRMANSYCEPKQECAHIDLSSIVKNEGMFCISIKIIYDFLMLIKCFNVKL